MGVKGDEKLTNDQKLDLILEKLDEHSKKFDGIDQRFDAMDRRLDDHQVMLSALIHGQEELIALFDGSKLETAKQFELAKEEQKDYGDSLELLEKGTLSNEKDIHRLKKLMGIN